jgi:hypothetical protein
MKRLTISITILVTLALLLPSLAVFGQSANPPVIYDSNYWRVWLAQHETEQASANPPVIYDSNYWRVWLAQHETEQASANPPVIYDSNYWRVWLAQHEIEQASANPPVIYDSNYWRVWLAQHEKVPAVEQSVAAQPVSLSQPQLSSNDTLYLGLTLAVAMLIAGGWYLRQRKATHVR